MPIKQFNPDDNNPFKPKTPTSNPSSPDMHSMVGHTPSTHKYAKFLAQQFGVEKQNQIPEIGELTNIPEEDNEKYLGDPPIEQLDNIAKAINNGNLPIAENPVPQPPVQERKQVQQQVPPQYEKPAYNLPPTKSPKLTASQSKQSKQSKPDNNADTETPPAFKDEEVLPLLDSILQDGYAIDTVNLRGLRVVLKTRFTWEDQAAFKFAESQNYESGLASNRTLYISLLAASLIQYGDTVFTPLNDTEDKAVLEKSYKERVDFVYSLNSMVIDILLRKNEAFGAKLGFLVENFDRLLQSF